MCLLVEHNEYILYNFDVIRNVHIEFIYIFISIAKSNCI